MEVSEIVFAEYNLPKDAPESKGLSVPRNENIEKIKSFKETGRIKCSEDQDKKASCDECKENECNIFFNNYTGLFSYKDKENIKQVLVIHKKLCRLLNQCKNQCKKCSKASNSSEIIEKYNQFFENFALEIIYNLTKHLPFHIISPVSAYVNEIDFTDNLTLKLLLIYQKRDEIRNSINQILSNPHRKIVKVNNICRHDEVTYIDLDVILDILQNPQRLIPCNYGCIVDKKDKKKYCPSQVMQYSIDESFDTLENRYVKTLLKNLIEMIKDCIVLVNEKIISSCSSNKDSATANIWQKVSKELTYLQYDIDQSLRHSFFKQVGEFSQLTSNSQVLIKQAGYRELFVLDRLLRVTILPTFISGFDEALSLKSMDVLWELYVMIKIIRAIKNMGYTIEEQKWDERFEKNTDYDNASFIFDKDNKKVKVLYQQSLKVGSKGNYTVRPDFLLEYPNGNTRIVIDAKFMVKDNVPTGEITKYLISKISSNESESPQRLSDAVFAACLEDGDDEAFHSMSFTHLFNERLYNKCDSLESLIKYYLKLDEYKKIKDKEQYIGYISIILPLKKAITEGYDYKPDTICQQN